MGAAVGQLAPGIQGGARLTRRLDAGALVAAGGGTLLFVSLFLDWYGDEADAISAWTVFELIDLLLAGVALLAISTCLHRAGVDRRLPDVSLVVLGLAALVLVASQLVNHPPAVNGGDLDAETGAWLALAGAALILAGAVMSIARVSFSVERRESAAPPPAQAETVRLDDPPA